MSDLLVFIVGAFIFGVTVYGTVIAGGIRLSRRELAENPDLRATVDAEELRRRVPVRVKY